MQARSALALSLCALVFPASALGQGPEDPPRLLRWGGPTKIDCCRSAPESAEGFSYRASPNTRRVTIVIQKRRCGTCAWREVGRYHRRPPQSGILPASLYRQLRIGSYRAWARAENAVGVSAKRYHRFSILRPDGSDEH